MKSSILFVAAIGLALGLAYCTFGPDTYDGPWPPDPAAEDGGGTTDDAAPQGTSGDDGGTPG